MNSSKGGAPTATPLDLEIRVAAAIEEIRPSLQAHGGDIELVGVENKVAKFRFLGHCVGCPMAQMTLFNLIWKTLHERVPELEDVMALDMEGEF
jgi:Fe-S cluster biogenesis protein NfuA